LQLQELYKKRQNDFAAKAAELKQKYIRFSIIRLVIFFMGTAMFTFLWSYGWAAVLFLVVFLAAFARFVYWHQAIQRDQIHHENLAKVNENEVDYLSYQFNQFDSGEQFMDTQHPNSIDMDLFGAYSFFQYCNRSNTSIGKKCLANWLSHPAKMEEISLRQESVQELQQQLDWRQNFQALGMSTEDSVNHLEALEKWLQMPPFVSNSSLLKMAMYIAPILGIAGVVLWLFYIPWQLAILFYVPAAIFLKMTLDKVTATHVQTDKAEKILAHYARLIHHLEGEKFSSKKLHDLQSVFFVGNENASTSVKKLSYIIQQLNVRSNPFAIVLNVFTLWDLHWVNRLEKWQALQKDHLLKWFDALQEIEAILSFSTLYYNHPEWIFPKVENKNELVAKQMGHPLIDGKERVCNDLMMPTEAHIKLITGSNMAGKSTFLRTAGLNIILAMSGSVVCAKEFSLPPLQVYTSMRTVDALHESTSSFYAELKRLKIIIEAVDAEQNIFFILDEILKGTNSRDRHTGSKALIQQFINSKGSGLIATHDLELGSMEAKSAGAIENLCMEVEVHEGKLKFDYTIKKGVSQSFNATLLMKQMGIRIQ
jgi:membrane protein implicated in regulation of membrane protease activity